MPPRPESDDRLMQASWHVWYEWTMLNNTASLLDSSEFSGDGHRRWAVLESFAMHARNLLGFFHLPKRFPTDIVAADFFLGEEAEWATRLGPRPAVLDNENKERLDREFAHLSYDRLLPDRPTRWPVAEMQAALNRMIETFRATVRRELLHAMWTNDDPRRLPSFPSPTSINTTSPAITSPNIVNSPSIPHGYRSRHLADEV